MPLIINTNISTLVERRNASPQDRSSSSLANLSLGVRGRVHAELESPPKDLELLRTEVRGLANKQQRATDGVSVLQVADGTLGSVAQSLESMREIALTAARGEASPERLASLEQEFGKLANQINDMVAATEFGGEKLLNGSAQDLLIQVADGDSDDDSIVFSLPAIASLPTDGSSVALQRIDEPGSARKALGAVEQAIEEVEGLRENIGAIQGRLFAVINEVATERENLFASNSRTVDVDAASETVLRTRDLIIEHSDEAVLAQSGQLSELAMGLL